MFTKFLRKESGATLVEYGVALILAIIVGGTALVTLADGVSNNMEAACGALQVATVAPTATC